MWESLIVISTIINSLFSTGGVILNNSLANLIKNQSYHVDSLALRVNKVPSYQLLEGKAQSIQFATRGWEIKEHIRLELLEIETDKISVNLNQLDNINGQNWRQVLNAPLAMGFRLIMTENDLNNLFKSALVQSLIDDLSTNSQGIKPQILTLNFDLLPDNRIIVNGKVKLADRDDEVLNVQLELGLELIKGHQFKIVNPQGTLNQRRLSSKLLQGFADNINMQLDLAILEKSGITLRLIKLDIEENTLDIVGLTYITNQ